jgi:hypothetical protein
MMNHATVATTTIPMKPGPAFGGAVAFPRLDCVVAAMTATPALLDDPMPTAVPVVFDVLASNAAWQA